MAYTSATFKSKTVLGLLRSAPNLFPSIKNVQAMYQDPEECMYDFVPNHPIHYMNCLSFFVEGADELVPVDGKDDVYDGIMTEICELEQELDKQLKKFEKLLGYEFSACDLSLRSC